MEIVWVELNEPVQLYTLCSQLFNIYEEEADHVGVLVKLKGYDKPILIGDISSDLDDNSEYDDWCHRQVTHYSTSIRDAIKTAKYSYEAGKLYIKERDLGRG